MYDPLPFSLASDRIMLWHHVTSFVVTAIIVGCQELAQRAMSVGRSSRPGTAGSWRGRPSSPFLERLEIDLAERKRRLKVQTHIVLYLKHFLWISSSAS